MVMDLNWPVDIVAVPIVREADGLALSWHNVYLSQAERTAALVLSRALQKAQTLLQAGERRSASVEAAAKEELAQEALAAVEYVMLVDAASLQPVAEIKRPVVLALAVRIVKTTLIDNLLWEEC